MSDLESCRLKGVRILQIENPGISSESLKLKVDEDSGIRSLRVSVKLLSNQIVSLKSQVSKLSSECESLKSQLPLTSDQQTQAYCGFRKALQENPVHALMYALENPKELEGFKPSLDEETIIKGAKKLISDQQKN